MDLQAVLTKSKRTLHRLKSNSPRIHYTFRLVDEMIALERRIVYLNKLLKKNGAK